MGKNKHEYMNYVKDVGMKEVNAPNSGTDLCKHKKHGGRRKGEQGES